MRQIFEGKIVGDEVLWKYFKIEHFISLLSKNQMYFASANQFDDRFEGAVAIQVPSQQVDPQYAEMEHFERAFFELKRLTKLNCWHRADYESDAMWKLYAGEHKGVAIRTTPDRMVQGFKPFRIEARFGSEDLWGGPIQYIDLTQVRMKCSMLERFFSSIVPSSGSVSFDLRFLYGWQRSLAFWFHLTVFLWKLICQH